MIVRSARRGDAGAIAALCSAATRGLYGVDDVDEEEVRAWFELPDLAMLVGERDDRVIGYADVHREDGGARFEIDLRVLPDARGRAAADRLLAAAEAWAAARACSSALARGYAAERDHHVGAALERAGYRVVRHSFRMRVDLSEEPVPPVWPAGISIRTYEPARDEEAVYDCVQGTFQEDRDYRRQPLDEWRRWMFRGRFDPQLWWLAEEDGELAAVCLDAWHFSGDPTFGWIAPLGVRRPWRRRGLGLALLRHSFRDFRECGATRVGLGVDADNPTGAVQLYERAGMRVERRNDSYEKVL